MKMFWFARYFQRYKREFEGMQEGLTVFKNQRFLQKTGFCI